MTLWNVVDDDIHLCFVNEKKNNSNSGLSVFIHVYLIKQKQGIYILSYSASVGFHRLTC